MPELGIPPERIVFITGIGCAGRFAYYMDTYGMHGIHGRAPALATGLATAREDLSIWVVTGDGDSLSIGGNHLIHALRRNVPVKILLFNNQIYGLTKGQASPTSELGKITKSTPFGVSDHPFNPVALALGAEATFVARTIDRDRHHLTEVLRAAATHEGAALVEIYQNCPVFNDGAFAALTDKDVKDANQIRLEAGEPIRFGRRARARRGARRRRLPGARGRQRGGRGAAARPRSRPRRPRTGVLAGQARRDPGRADPDRDLPRRRAPGLSTSARAPSRPPSSSSPTCSRPATPGPWRERCASATDVRLRLAGGRLALRARRRSRRGSIGRPAASHSSIPPVMLWASKPAWANASVAIAERAAAAAVEHHRPGAVDRVRLGGEAAELDQARAGDPAGLVLVWLADVDQLDLAGRDAARRPPAGCSPAGPRREG